MLLLRKKFKRSDILNITYLDFTIFFFINILNSMKWPSTKFFQAIGFTGFTLGVFNTINVYRSKNNVTANFHDIINRTEKIHQRIEELSEHYSNGNEIVKEEIKNYMLKCIELKIQSNPQQNLNVKVVDESLNSIELIHNKIIFKTNLYNNTVNPIEKSLLQQDINSLNIEFESKISLAIEKFNTIKPNIGLTQTDILKIIDEIKRSGNNFIDSDLFNNFYNYLSTLNLEQSLAITNLFGIFIILITLISIISIFYGNLLLNYFNLENRYPKLSKLINLRRKFQQYYLLWNVIIISIVSITMLLINLTILF